MRWCISIVGISLFVQLCRNFRKTTNQSNLEGPNSGFGLEGPGLGLEGPGLALIFKVNNTALHPKNETSSNAYISIIVEV